MIAATFRIITGHTYVIAATFGLITGHTYMIAGLLFELSQAHLRDRGYRQQDSKSRRGHFKVFGALFSFWGYLIITMMCEGVYDVRGLRLCMMCEGVYDVRGCMM